MKVLLVFVLMNLLLFGCVQEDWWPDATEFCKSKGYESSVTRSGFSNPTGTYCYKTTDDIYTEAKIIYVNDKWLFFEEEEGT